MLCNEKVFVFDPSVKLRGCSSHWCRSSGSGTLSNPTHNEPASQDKIYGTDVVVTTASRSIA